MDIKQALKRISEHGHFSQEEMQMVMRQIMTGECTDSQIGAFLMGLRMKGETIEEITGAAMVMRELAARVEVTGDYLVDTCGTGGDGQDLFNVSTASAFVAAAAGARVAKHGNRGVSSNSGSADVLEQADISIDFTPAETARAVDSIGVGFMFAPSHHSAMKYAIGPRKELGLRTIFNIIGPLTNPANVKRQVIGVFSETLCEPLAYVLKRLGSEHVMVVHSRDGLDEFSIGGANFVAELKDGEVRTYSVRPEDLGLATQSLAGLAVNSSKESYEIIKNSLTGADDEVSARAADIIAFNSGAAIYVSGVAESFEAGVAMAQDAISTGLAFEKLKELAAFSAALEGE
ncbi:MAG: anthranilate phosphoribosyltransferase [Saccharospirillum sp.]|nr:anthranilate phosphoribosyltransferase [Saccharospirillum sp.]